MAQRPARGHSAAAPSKPVPAKKAAKASPGGKTAPPTQPAKPAKPAKSAKSAAPAKPEKPAPKAPAVKAPTAKPATRPATPKPAPARDLKPDRGVTAGTTSRPAPVSSPRDDVQGGIVTEQDQKHFEERLLRERARLLKELGYLEANVLKQNPRESSGDLSGYSFHMADAGTDAMEREKAFLFASAEGRALHDVDEALRRLYSGAYGACESCQKPIARARLEVVPHARLCVPCKEKEERAARR